MNIMIDNKISNILSLLDAKKSTHPNLSSVWKYYIINKLEQFNKELDNGLHIFNTIEQNSNNDIDIQAVYFLYLLLRV
ncbi:MAG: hypothetical protein CL678_05785 [Bdellovibrionaceae bacterium]|nr:hypothetical protein [Pseudobdellovibrionaceae bacterium]